MKIDLQALIKLIGEYKLEEILNDYVQDLEQPKVSKVGRPRKVRSDVGTTARRTKLNFTDEERVIIESRARELFPESKNWATVSTIIAREGNKGRTTASIYNYLYRLGLIKEFANVTAQK